MLEESVKVKQDRHLQNTDGLFGSITSRKVKWEEMKIRTARGLGIRMGIGMGWQKTNEVK